MLLLFLFLSPVTTETQLFRICVTALVRSRSHLGSSSQSILRKEKQKKSKSFSLRTSLSSLPRLSRITEFLRVSKYLVDSPLESQARQILRRRYTVGTLRTVGQPLESPKIEVLSPRTNYWHLGSVSQSFRLLYYSECAHT